MKSIVLLFSGGYDSSLCALLLGMQGDTAIHALSITYPGRPKGEIEAACQLSKRLKFSSFHSADLDLSLPLWDSLDSTVARRTAIAGAIPYRNLMFWSMAAFYAAKLNASAIAAGHTRSDAANYSDASVGFFERFQELTKFIGNDTLKAPLQFILPLQTIATAEYNKLAKNASSLLAESWSCWHDNANPCGLCYSCRERMRYLESLAVKPDMT